MNNSYHNIVYNTIIKIDCTYCIYWFAEKVDFSYKIISNWAVGIKGTRSTRYELSFVCTYFIRM